MAMITFRIDDSVRDQLHDLAEGRGVSVSDVLRSLIVGVLDEGEGSGPSRYVVPESMTVVERRQLDRAQALEEGWTKEYGVEFDAMQSELSRRDCGLVMDILDMFRVLQDSVAAAGDQLAAYQRMLERYEAIRRSAADRSGHAGRS